MKTTYVVFGGYGQLGQAMLKVVPGDVDLIQVGRNVDLLNYEKIITFLKDIYPSVVVNAAAYTDVKGAESNVDEAYKTNAVAAGLIAKACEELGIRLIHISTDYVFSGKNKEEPYTRFSHTAPLNVYGQSKNLGEDWVLSMDSDNLILRTSWVYSEFGNNFAKTIITRARNGQKIFEVVNDQFGTPTYAPDLAKAIYEYGHGRKSTTRGIEHYAGSVVISWYSFAKCLTWGMDSVIVLESKTDPNALPKRPAYSALDTDDLEPSDLEDGIRETLANLS